MRRLPILFCLLLPLTLFSGEIPSRPGLLHLNLGKAIRMALAKNFTIEAAQFGPKIARENVTQALGEFDPVFGLAYHHSAEDHLSRILSGREVSRFSDAISDEWTAGLAGKTALGTTYNLGASTNLSSSELSPFPELFETSAGVEIKQPLLRGFGTDVNLANVRIARNHVLVSEWELRKNITDTITQTVSIYNDLAHAQKQLAVAQRSKDLAFQLYRDNANRAKIGTMSPLDVTTARAEVAAREQEVITAAAAVNDNKIFLKQLVTNDLDAMLDIDVEIEEPPSPSFLADIRGGIRQAFELRPEYRQALLKIQEDKIQVVVQQNGVLPQLDLVGSLKRVGFGTRFGNSVTRLGDGDHQDWTVGAIFSVPIPNREARGAANAARLNAARSLISLQRLEQDIIVQIHNASNSVLTNRQKIISAEEARKLAEESLAAGEERLRAGTGTTFEVLELQKKLSDSEATEVRARADYNKAVSEYYSRTGTTLRVYHVKVE